MKIEDLLKPVSAESPCGPNLEYDDPDFLQLKKILETPKENMLGANQAKEVNWSEVITLVEALLSRTKDLRLAVWIIKPWIHRDGLAGLVNGLHLVNDLLTLYWVDIHPQLDAEDDNDPTMRLSVLSEIGDYETFVKDVQNIPIIFQYDKISIRDILVISGKLSVANHQSEYTQAQIEAMFQDQANASIVKNLHNLLTETLESLEDIQNFLRQHVSEEYLPNFKRLSDVLRPILLLCKSSDSINHDSEEKMQSSSIALDGKMNTSSTSNEIRSREDIVRILENVSRYIERTEPTNPVSLIVRLAQTLMTKNFLEIIEAIPPEDMKVFKKIIDADKKK